MKDEYHAPHTTATSWVTWLALAVASLALVLGWMAYNRSGKDLEDSVKDTTTTVVDEAGNKATQATDAAEKAVDTGPDGVDDGAN